MAQPTKPWGHNLEPIAGTGVPGLVIHAGTFTTDSSGNVTSVSGLNPGVSVSGTSLSSGVYTMFFGTGPSINQIGTNAIGRATNDLPGVGSPQIVDSFNRVLFLQAHVVQDNGVPTSDFFQTTQKDARAGQGKIQYLKSDVTKPIASGQYVAQPYAPALCASKTVEVVAMLWVHKDVT